MNIRYNASLRRFEAEFSTDFNGDLSAVKISGFKPDTSSGAWVWWTAKAAVLNKIRENKPASGLTITNEAYDAYVPLAEQETRNAEVKKQAAAINKAAKKERKNKELEAATTSLFAIPEGKIWIGPDDLPPKPPFVSTIAPIPPFVGPVCVFCAGPVYFYELQNPPTCLWCELHPQITLDKTSGLC